MKLTSILTAAFLCLATIPAQAGIIYEWKALNNKVPYGIGLQLEFDRSAVSKGEFKFELQAYHGNEPRPVSGLISLRYTFPGIYDPLSYHRSEEPLPSDGEMMFDLKFEKGGFLTGYIYANNTEHHFEMASNGRVFNMIDANSDQGMEHAGCGFPSSIPCNQATGQIRRTDIPEPTSIALLALGAFGAMAVRRKAKQKAR